MRKIGMFLSGIVVGGLVGATFALLLAPASGEQLRRQITDYTNQSVSEIRHAAQQKRTDLEERLAQLRQTT